MTACPADGVLRQVVGHEHAEGQSDDRAADQHPQQDRGDEAHRDAGASNVVLDGLPGELAGGKGLEPRPPGDGESDVPT